MSKKMKEPVAPREPWPFDYDAKVEKKYIYSYYVSARDDDYDDDEEYEEGEGPWWKEPPEIDLSQVDLLWLANKAQEHGVQLQDVKIELGEDSCCMSFDGYYVRFYYEVKIPKKKKEYEAARKKYEAELAQYQKDKAEYDAWKHEEEIKALEARLAKMKGGKA